MIVKIVVLFLVCMVALAMFGRLRLPRAAKPRRCPACGRHRIGRGPCACGAGQ